MDSLLYGAGACQTLTIGLNYERSCSRSTTPGAVPLDLLKTEQERISKRLAFLEEKIEAGDTKYEQTQAHLDDCLALARDRHASYTSIDDSLHRIANQAFFDKLYATEADTIDGEPGVPFSIMFNPEAQSTALLDQAGRDLSRTQTDDIGGLNNEHWVGPVGLEPTTRGLKVRCSTS